MNRLIPQGTSPSTLKWAAEAVVWLLEYNHLHAQGGIKKIVLIKERPWSTVWRVEFTQSISYFKACDSGGFFEPMLLNFLSSLNCPFLPQIQAAEFSNKWLLLADAGQSLREESLGEAQIQTISTLLIEYAKLQISSIEHLSKFLTFRVPDRRLYGLPSLVQDIFKHPLLTDYLDPEDLQRLHQAATNKLPAFEKLCAELDKRPFSQSLDHGDLHLGNMIIKDNVVQLCDWGDASITHPFCSLMVLFEMLFENNKDPRVHRWQETLRDAYLKPWQSIWSGQSLRIDFEKAREVAQVIRLLDFVHMFEGAEKSQLLRWQPLIVMRLQSWVSQTKDR